MCSASANVTTNLECLQSTNRFKNVNFNIFDNHVKLQHVDHSGQLLGTKDY